MFLEAAAFGGDVGDPAGNNKHNLRLSFPGDDGILIFAEMGYTLNPRSTAGTVIGRKNCRAPTNLVVALIQVSLAPAIAIPEFVNITMRFICSPIRKSGIPIGLSIAPLPFSVASGSPRRIATQ